MLPTYYAHIYCTYIKIHRYVQMVYTHIIWRQFYVALIDRYSTYVHTCVRTYIHSAQVHTLQTKLLFLSRIMVSKAFCQMLWKPWSSGPWFSGVANLHSDSRSRYPTCTDSPLPFQGKRLQRGNATTKINWVWVGGKEIQSTQHLVLILLHVRFTHKRFTQLSFSQDRLIFNHNIN